MTQLRYSTGVLLSGSKDIIEEMNNFYQDLFSEEDLEAQNRILHQLSFSLNKMEHALWEGFLTVEECHRMLNGMDTGKSPGIDSLTVQFYLAFGYSLEIIW